MKRLILLAALLASPAFGYVIKETKSNENMTLYVSPSGTPTIGLAINGTTGAVSAPISFSSPSITGMTTPLSLSQGGTNKNATAVNGGLVWSDGDSFEVTAAAGQTSQWVLTTASGTPTFADTTTRSKSVSVDDAATATALDLLTVNHSSTGTPAPSFGSALLFTGESTTTNNRELGRIQATWTVATDASRSSQLEFQTVNAAAAPVTRMTITETGNVNVGGSTGFPRLQPTSSDEALPTYSFVGDTDTGMYRTGANRIGWATGGVSRFYLDSAGIFGANDGVTGSPAMVPGAGSVTAPTFTFNGDSNTGMFRAGGDVLVFTTAGTEKLSIGTSTIEVDLPIALANDLTRFTAITSADGTSCHSTCNTSGYNCIGATRTVSNDADGVACTDTVGSGNNTKVCICAGDGVP